MIRRGAERFRDRHDAGRQLAALLAAHEEACDVVLALPRGGVPVGVEVAAALGAELEVLMVRKLGVPRHAELGMGAVAEGGVRVLNDELIAQLGVTARQIDETAAAELAELERRVRVYRGGRPMLDVRNRKVVVVDDGLATGVTASAAVKAIRALGPATVVFAVPVASADALGTMEDAADRAYAVSVPRGFRAVGQFYDDFRQVSDDEVCSALAASSQ